MQGRKEYLHDLERRLDRWTDGIAALKAKGAQAQLNAKVEYARELQALEARRAAVAATLDAIREADGEAWETLRPGADDAATELDGALEAARRRLA